MYPRERHAIVADGKKNDQAMIIVVAVIDTGIEGLSKTIYEALTLAEAGRVLRHGVAAVGHDHDDAIGCQVTPFKSLGGLRSQKEVYKHEVAS